MYIEDCFSTSYRCPMKRPKDGEISECDGSHCALWRWKPELNPDWKPDGGMMMMSTGVDYRTKPPPYIDSKTHGYCGLGTRPNLPG